MATAADAIVVGGGLTGLTTAFRLHRAGLAVTLVDAGARPGGNLRTARITNDAGEWLLDLGPNSFGDAASEFMQLVRDAGVERQLLPAVGDAGRRFLFARGRLREVPNSPVGMLRAPLMPLRSRLRMAWEPFVSARPDTAPEESLAEFCDRRLGRGAREKLLTPVVGGIYAGDPERLGATSAFPRMVELERRYGSLVKAMLRGQGPPSRGQLHSFREGLAALPVALADALGDRYVGSTSVTRVARDHARWTVELADGEQLTARDVVLATPAHVTAELLRPTAPKATDELAAIDAPPMAVVHVGVPSSALPALPDGFGFLVPRDEGLRILGAVFSSKLFAGRAPAGHELLTVFTGGALDRGASELEDSQIREYVLRDLETALGTEPRAELESSLVMVTRWPRSIPQYEVGHADRLRRISLAMAPHAGLRLAGNWKGGIAMPDCVRSAEELARRIVASRPSDEQDRAPGADVGTEQDS